MGYGRHDREIALVEDGFDGRLAVFYDGQPLVTLERGSGPAAALAADLAKAVPPSSSEEDTVAGALAAWIEVASDGKGEDWAPRAVAVYTERPGHAFPLPLEERYESGMDSAEDGDAWFDEAFREVLRLGIGGR